MRPTERLVLIKFILPHDQRQTPRLRLVHPNRTWIPMCPIFELRLCLRREALPISDCTHGILTGIPYPESQDPTSSSSAWLGCFIPE